jgi:uncharacterized protein (DUF885 family)
MTMRRTAAILLAGALCACTTPAPRDSAATASVDVTPLFAQFWDEFLALYPLQATYVGDTRFNDRLPNSLTETFRDRERAFNRGWLERIRGIETAGLSEQDRLSVDIFIQAREQELERLQHPEHLLPLNQFYSFANIFAQLGSGTSAQPFATLADYEAWLRRMAQIPAIFDQAIANMRAGARIGLVQPRALMTKVLPQLDALIIDDPRQTLFWQPLTRLPETITPTQREALEKAYAEAISTELMPAYRRLRDFVRDDYLSQTRNTDGLGALPGGDDWYAYNLRRLTTTDLTAEQIHRTGLDEVARIHAEMRRVIAGLGFDGDLHAFFAFLTTDPQFKFASEADLLARYNSLRERVEAGAAALFSMTPKADFEIRPVEAFRARSAAGGSYMRPSEDGIRPGIFYVNTYDLPSRKTWDMEDLFLHEAIPGHHFQLALQQELDGVPAFRRFGTFTAYVEGWGLYAESLGRELGVYTDPYMYFGYLQNELWRAIRLVVDTGLHAKGWSRQQVIDYMLANSAESETQAIAEAERYMAIPGQATAYKIGELRIRALRTKAEAALGEAFDIRNFHAQVLKDGAVPLDVLDAKIERWIAAQRD